jgi:endonuclease-3
MPAKPLRPRAHAPSRKRETGARKAPLRADAAAIWKRLHRALPHPRCELDHANAWQLVVATILSAQSTDARVNLVTPGLFGRYPTPAALGAADLGEVETLVRSTGFFRNKAKAIVGASRMIAERFDGQVPRTIDAAMELPGVARKTANLVLGTAYGIASGVIVDTHAGRVARRLGLTEHEDPEKVERDLCAQFPSRNWVALGHSLVLHGRYVCTARDPACSHCPLQELCPAAAAPAEGSVSERTSWEALRVPRSQLPDGPPPRD